MERRSAILSRRLWTRGIDRIRKIRITITNSGTTELVNNISAEGKSSRNARWNRIAVIVVTIAIMNPLKAKPSFNQPGGRNPLINTTSPVKIRLSNRANAIMYAKMAKISPRLK